MGVVHSQTGSRFGGKSAPWVVRLFLILAFISVLGMPAGSAQAACDPEFQQVNENGFGSRFQLYAWSMTNFVDSRGEDHLYVGTYPRLGTAQIWRYNGTIWHQVVDRGLGNRYNKGIRSMLVYQNALYAGVWNQQQGAQLWRTFDGVNWQVVVMRGFDGSGNESIRALREFDGYLYAGTHNPDGFAQLWRSANGTDWNPVNITGLGDTTNNSIHDLQVFRAYDHPDQIEYLYAATRNQVKGAQIWRSANGIDFEVVVGDGAAAPSGFGDRWTTAVFHQEVFNGHLYVGTLNFRSGFDMQRTADGVTFEKVGQAGFGAGSCAPYAWRFGVYENQLWMGGLNTCSGGTIWRTANGTDWQQMVGASPGALWPGGFGDATNWGIRSIGVYQDKLYFGTAECFDFSCFSSWDGTEIWEWPGEACP
jgi:hypothetical protein